MQRVCGSCAARVRWACGSRRAARVRQVCGGRRATGVRQARGGCAAGVRVVLSGYDRCATGAWWVCGRCAGYLAGVWQVLDRHILSAISGKEAVSRKRRTEKNQENRIEAVSFKTALPEACEKVHPLFLFYRKVDALNLFNKKPERAASRY